MEKIAAEHWSEVLKSEGVESYAIAHRGAFVVLASFNVDLPLMALCSVEECKRALWGQK